MLTWVEQWALVALFSLLTEGSLIIMKHIDGKILCMISFLLVNPIRVYVQFKQWTMRNSHMITIFWMDVWRACSLVKDDNRRFYLYFAVGLNECTLCINELFHETKHTHFCSCFLCIFFSLSSFSYDWLQLMNSVYSVNSCPSATCIYIYKARRERQSA